jgi:hypothetical protein
MVNKSIIEPAYRDNINMNMNNKKKPFLVKWLYYNT